MEISGILPVSMGDTSSRSLNDDFAATTPSGENVFAKPLGDKCVWRTPDGGCVCLSFMFDPNQKYTRKHTYASVVTDCFGEFRDHLTKHLLEEKDIAPKTKTLEETMWETITSTLPKETLSKNVFSKPEQLEDYLDLLRRNVTTSYNEEKLMTETLQTTEFSFAYQVAIDAYPQLIRGKKPPAGEKCGVLTLHIQGFLKGSEEGKAALNGPAETPSKKSKESKESKDTKSKKSKDTEDSDKLQMTRTASGDSNSSKKRKLHDEDDLSEKEKLLQDLGIGPQLLDCVTCSDKEFPLTATLFFEAVGRWFASTVGNMSAKMEKARNRNPLYQ